MIEKIILLQRTNPLLSSSIATHVLNYFLQVIIHMATNSNTTINFLLERSIVSEKTSFIFYSHEALAPPAVFCKRDLIIALFYAVETHIHLYDDYFFFAKRASFMKRLTNIFFGKKFFLYFC